MNDETLCHSSFPASRMFRHLSTKFSFQVLDKGPTSSQSSILQILHCIVHYIDVSSSPSQSINADLLRVVAKYVEVCICGHKGVIAVRRRERKRAPERDLSTLSILLYVHVRLKLTFQQINAKHER